MGIHWRETDASASSHGIPVLFIESFVGEEVFLHAQTCAFEKEGIQESTRMF